MFKNYFKTAWRSLFAGKIFSVINIAGLAISMAGSLLILLWLSNEISFDKFHANKDRLHEVYVLASNVDGKAFAIPMTSQPLGPALQQKYPEIEEAARMKGVGGFLFTADNKSFTGIQGSFVDPSFLRLFSFPLKEGNPVDQLKNVYSITITERLAKQLFGNEEALGKTIRLDSNDNFRVTGILKDLPANTRFEFDYLLPWDYLKRLGKGWSNESWLSNNIHTFVLLKPNTNLAATNEKIKNTSRENAGRNDIWTHFLYPLSQWHLYGSFENGVPVGGRIDRVRIFGIVAAFILLIACINFMNLSTARSGRRAKEIGIRKVSGATKGLLVGQFITEAVVTSSIAGAAALLIVQLSLPAFNMLINTRLYIPYHNVSFWIYALGFILFTSLLAGSYPAFYLSAFNPVGIFRKQFQKTQSALSPRKVLVVVQFTFAIILIISTLVIHNQVQYAENRDKGYSNNNLVYVDFAGDIKKNYALIKRELLNTGIAVSVTKNMFGITGWGARTWAYRWPGEIPKDTNTTLFFNSADADLAKTTGMQLVAGRDIDINKYPSDSFSVVLNETAVKLMGFKNPLGQPLFKPYNHITMHVVGVVKDYIAGSPYDEVPPTLIEGPNSYLNTMHIKLNPAFSTAENLAKAEQVFKKYNPAYPFDYKFIDAEYAKNFDSEQRTRTMAGLFATLAIFISCLGLFGLSAYIAASRIKEIGVRKILGASVFTITKLLSLDFVKLVFISIVIATPIAWYAMNKWLQNYSYRINISWEIFGVAGLLAIFIAIFTVSIQSINAAIANPVKSLRTE